MLIWAVQVAGLNRAKIRDVLAHRNEPWPGVTGNIPLSACLDDMGPVFLARRHAGAWHYLSREDLGLERKGSFRSNIAREGDLVSPKKER